MLMGIVFKEIDNSHILINKVTRKRSDGIRAVKPLEFFKKIAQTTSKTPAMIKSDQLKKFELMK